MRCHDNLVIGDLSAVGDYLVRHPLDGLGVLIYRQLSGDGVQKFQRMKLRLPRHAHRPRHLKRQVRLPDKARLDAKTLQRLHLPLERGALLQGIDIGIARLIIAVDVAAQTGILLCCPRLRLQIPFCHRLAETLDQFVIDQAVREGDFGGGVSRDPRTDVPCLDHGAVNTRVFELVRAQKPCHSRTDDQNIGAFIFSQCIKMQLRHPLLPNRLHILSP